MQVRWMIRRDLNEVLEIEKHSFDEPWNEKDFLDALRQKNCIGMVVEQADKVYGYIVYELRTKSLFVLNMAVHGQYRNKGYGTAILNKIKSKLSVNRRPDGIQMDLIETNLGGQLFLRTQGFKATAVLRKEYNDRDVFVMRYLQDQTVLA